MGARTKMSLLKSKKRGTDAHEPNNLMRMTSICIVPIHFRLGHHRTPILSSNFWVGSVAKVVFRCYNVTLLDSFSLFSEQVWGKTKSGDRETCSLLTCFRLGHPLKPDFSTQIIVASRRKAKSGEFLSRFGAMCISFVENIQLASLLRNSSRKWIDCGAPMPCGAVSSLL